jgi:isoleucyl-tRNA synthetase
MSDNNQAQNQRVSFPELEEKALSFWNTNQIFQKSVDQEAPRGDYVFYDGPPFATGTPHYGHLVGSILKDVVPRYFTMNGYRVERRWGWDCHGLPIENIVEKELGTKTKKEIIELGVAKFNDLCRSKVMTYADEWEKVIMRLGRWADMKNSYRTMDLDYMESVWWTFKQLWDKDLIYKDYRSMHVCPRCETTLSQSEVTEGYQDIKDLSAIAKFELVEEPGTFVLAWTTTPWTLIGNVALAVGADIDYVKVKSAEGVYIIAKELVEKVMKDKPFEIISEIKGSDLVGKFYQPLFPYYSNNVSLENRQNGWQIYAAEFVTTTDGTGVVHIAPAFGEDDMNLGREKGLPFVQHVGTDGMFKSEVLNFPGLHVKPLGDHTATDIEIIKYLAAQGTLFHKEKYEHSYPHCWRCATPLINYATSSWFVGVTKIKERLLESAKNINWSPDYLKNGRFGNWLEGARDWSISRQRFWASAMPIWECECGERKVLGSVAELEELTGQKITDIHKDKVDLLTFKCEKCQGAMTRIPDVMDCWFESGSMPYAQLHYPFENKEKFEKNFPAQFIAEGVDQTRCWFYYLHVISGGIRSQEAFKNVIVNGIVQAEDGKKMAKRDKNYPDPMYVLEKYGADALRAYLLASPVVQAENLNFSEKGTEESLRKNLMILWNVYKFYEMFSVDLNDENKQSENILDLWIIAKFNLLLKDVTEAMENYNLQRAMRPITEFIDELSTWYLRRSRERFKSEDENDKQSALATTKYVLLELSKVLAPFMPFVAENLWQNLTGHKFSDGEKSVHLEKWTAIKNIDEKSQTVLSRMELVRKIVELGLAARDSAGIKIRQMLTSLTVRTKELELDGEYLELIKDELNIQEVIWEKLENDFPEVVLDTVITSELKLEGLKREIVRFVNMLRKEAGLTLSDRVLVYLETADTEVISTVEKFKEDLKKDTLSDDLLLITIPESIASKEVSLGVEKSKLAIVKQ